MKLYTSKSRQEQLAIAYGSVAFNTSLEVGMDSLAKQYYKKAQSIRNSLQVTPKPIKHLKARSK